MENDGKRILIIDDNPDIHDDYVAVLCGGETAQELSALERQVKRLIADLSADEFEIRQEACDRLEALGLETLPWLTETWGSTPSAFSVWWL